MAATSSIVFVGSVLGAKQRISVSIITGDSSYVTDGELITANQLGLTRITALIPVANSGYIPVWDQDNSKLKVFYGDNNNTSDGPLIEIPNATNIATVTFTVIAFGV
jgi:hypothetical protein